MNPFPCSSLDDYLAHDLAGDAHAQFAAHLADCPDCRRAVGGHERLATLLSEAADRLELVPVGLTERVRGRLRSARRRRVAAAVTALAATAAVVWLLGRPGPPPGEPEPARVEVKPEAPAPDAPRRGKLVRVTFPAGADLVVVPAETDSPNVTFIRVYRGLRNAPPSRPAADDPPSPPGRSDS